MKAYYLARVYPPSEALEAGWRPATSDLGAINQNPFLPMGADNRPTNSNWCLVVIGDTDHAAYRSHPDVFPLPVFPLDGVWSAINSQTKGATLTALSALGIHTGWISNAMGYREILDRIGKLLSADFDINSFDINEA